MKKLITVIISAILLFSCLGFTTFAENSSVTISDDYQKLYLNGDSYSRINTSMLEIGYYTPLGQQVELNATQQEAIKEISLDRNEHENIIFAEISFYDGAVLSVEFLQDDYLETYNEMVSGQGGEYIIDFEYPDGNIVKTEKEDLFSNPVTLSENDLEFCDYYNVTTQSTDGSLTVMKGSLIIVDDKYYYVDYTEVGVENRNEFSPYGFAELSAHEITDTDLLQNIKVAEDEYYADDLGFLYDDNFTESISAVFLIFIFAIIPLAIFIVFLILAIRAKSVYRKLFSTICILSAAVLAIFSIITTFVMMVK